MAFSVINVNAAEQLMSALCNTLLHSLWQGILLAAVAGLIIISTKKATAALRYNLLITALLLFAVGIIVTFTTQLQQPVAVIHLVNPLPQNVIVPAANQPVAAGADADFRNVLTAYLNNHHDTIVLIWFLIICAKTMRFGFGLYGTYRLKRVDVLAVASHWQQSLQQLANLLGIRETITLLESGLAKVPMVIGNLKPVILIPIGLLTALSAEEVEAILVHELAHIRRRDYLVNMLQSLMEMIFFFNPAVLWLSQLIKTERENCCDDLALAQSNNKVNYIKALLSCEEYQSAVPAYAMAFPGGKNTLLNRVKRLADNRNHSLNLFEKTALAVCLVVSGLCLSAYAAREDIKHGVRHVVAAVHLNATKPLPVTIPAKSAGISEQKTAIRKSVPQDTIKSKFHFATNMIDSLLKRGNSNNIVSAIGRELYKMQLIADTNHLTISLSDKELIVNGVKLSEDVRRHIYKKFPLGSRTNVSSGNDGDNSVYKAPYNASHYQPNYPVNPAYRPENMRERAHRDSIANTMITLDLLKDNIITDADHFNFKLTRKQFIVNGIEQDEAVLERYRQKYIPVTDKPDDNWTWTHSINRP